MFPHLENIYVGFFSDTMRTRAFKTLHDYNLAWDLHFHCRFDDLDFVSRSQVCQKYKVQIVLFLDSCLL